MFITSKAVYFDLDGTLAGTYSVPNWLEMLRAYDPTPYQKAVPLVRMASLARILNRLQREGWVIGIVSWLSKEPTPEYDMAVTQAKMEWLRSHLASVHFDEVHIIPYGTPKSQVVKVQGGILFDDEEQNRLEWGEGAYDVQNIIEVLRGL